MISSSLVTARQVHQPAERVEDGEAGGPALTPGEVDSDEEHGHTLAHGPAHCRAGRESGREVTSRRVEAQVSPRMENERRRSPENQAASKTTTTVATTA